MAPLVDSRPALDHADIGFAGLRIVDAVACRVHDAAFTLQPGYELDLVDRLTIRSPR